jgi:ketosteroid isomerase-like protein
VELVRRFNRSWSERDLAGALECAHAELEFDWSDSLGPLKGIYMGHEGLRRFWSELWEAWDEFRPELEEVIEWGEERLVSVNLIRARGKGSGIAIEARGAIVWTVRDRKLFKGKMFQNKEEALEAVGPGAEAADTT